MVNERNIHQLVAGILETDPIPFQNINVDGIAAYKLIFNSIWEQYQIHWKNPKKEEEVTTEEILLSIIIKTICENFYLHTKLLMLGEADE